MSRRKASCVALAWIAFATSFVTAQSPLTISIVPGSTLATNAPALAAFNRAAAQWTNLLTTVTPTTVVINADFANLGGGGIIGSTGSGFVAGSFDTIRNAMVSTASLQPSKSIMNSLPTASQFTATLPGGVGLSGNIQLTRANAKALGFGIGAGGDATMTFNTQFSFDFDNSNGVPANQMDFETVAAHEIGHALGFVSRVDGISNPASPYPLDLYRFASGNIPTNSAQFTTNARQLTTGGAPSFSDTVSSYLLSTVTDGNQASHWKADDITGNYIGIMDPTLNFGTIQNITSADLRAMYLIGYNPVPEPAAILATCAVVGGAFGYWRRRKAAQSLAA